MMFPTTVSFVAAFTVAVLMSHNLIDTAYAQSSSLSDQCASENLALDSNEALIAASNVTGVELSSNAKDYGPTSGEYKDACLDAGGQFVTTDILYDCQAFNVIAGGIIPLPYAAYSVPFCFGVSCSESDILAYMDDPYIATETLALAREGITCQIEDSNLVTIGGSTAEAGSLKTSDAETLQCFIVNTCFYIVPSLLFTVVMAL